MDLLSTPVSRGRYVFDLETDGLLPEVTRIHCAVIYDLDTFTYLVRTGQLQALSIPSWATRPVQDA